MIALFVEERRCVKFLLSLSWPLETVKVVFAIVNPHFLPKAGFLLQRRYEPRIQNNHIKWFIRMSGKKANRNNGFTRVTITRRDRSQQCALLPLLTHFAFRLPNIYKRKSFFCRQEFQSFMFHFFCMFCRARTEGRAPTPSTDTWIYRSSVLSPRVKMLLLVRLPIPLYFGCLQLLGKMNLPN